jgi:hypothetical protein
MKQYYNTKLYLDITIAKQLDLSMGRQKFKSFLEKYLIITVDKECYDYLISIQNKNNDK